MLYACDILSAVILLVNGLKELDLNKFLVVLCSSRKYRFPARQGFALWPPRLPSLWGWEVIGQWILIIYKVIYEHFNMTTLPALPFFMCWHYFHLNVTK